MFGFYRVATCSPVVKVADTEFNAARILELAEKAAAHTRAKDSFSDRAGKVSSIKLSVFMIPPRSLREFFNDTVQAGYAEQLVHMRI